MITGILLTILLASPVAYLLQHLVVAYLCGPRDLKKAYRAQWALVTGASSGMECTPVCRHCISNPARLWPVCIHTCCGLPSAHLGVASLLPSWLMWCAAGIGKALAKKLASQGLNVVLVALPDKLLQETHAELSSSYPAVTFRPVHPQKAKPLALCLTLLHHPMQLCGGRWEQT